MYANFVYIIIINVLTSLLNLTNCHYVTLFSSCSERFRLEFNYTKITEYYFTIIIFVVGSYMTTKEIER